MTSFIQATEPLHTTCYAAASLLILILTRTTTTEAPPFLRNTQLEQNNIKINNLYTLNFCSFSEQNKNHNLCETWIPKPSEKSEEKEIRSFAFLSTFRF
jgi:hypothetical protein